MWPSHYDSGNYDSQAYLSLWIIMIGILVGTYLAIAI